MTATTPKLLSDLVAHGNCVPSNYIRPVSDRPNLCYVETADSSVPLIDLRGFGGPYHSLVVEAIGFACQNDGFFLIKNHGIPEQVVEDMLCVAREFFLLPEAEKMKFYSDDPSKTTRLSTSFNVRTEKISNWRDFLRLHCYPLQDFIHEWPSNPPIFRQVVGEYSSHVRELALKLLRLISESLQLDKDYMEKALGKQAQHMAINYYPRCPQPELTYGLPAHKDPNAITILLQDDVPGLQVLRNNTWVTVHPIPGTLIINTGDQIQALSNGKYKSVLHRAVVNSEIERISVPTFYCPSPDAVIEPAESLVDEDKPAVYRRFNYGEYYERFWKGGLETDSCLPSLHATQ